MSFFIEQIKKFWIHGTKEGRRDNGTMNEEETDDRGLVSSVAVNQASHPSRTSLQMSNSIKIISEEETDDPLAGMEPSVMVDQASLPSQTTLQKYRTPKGQPYYVNGETFYIEDNSTEELRRFRVYAQRLTNVTANDNNTRPLSSSESDFVEDDQQNEDKELEITIQRVHSYGIVVNSNVYLTDRQWNTIVHVDAHLVQCAACELFTDEDSCSEHVRGDEHKAMLDKWRPLARFDLSITRKIRNLYHCAVCNELFGRDANFDEEYKHFASESHTDKLLSAINKVSDFDLTANGRNDENEFNDCYHFNAAAINNRRNERNNNTSNGNTDNVRVFMENKVNDRYFNGNFGNDSPDSFEEDSEYEEDNIDSLWGDIGQQNQNTGSSYATMLKKPKVAIPVFLEKDLGHKKVKVRFDSYHMLIQPKLNKFYCMVCKDYGHIRSKGEHCSDEDHLALLNRCRVVNKFPDYFIREMDDKLYHCGHCNNLVLINDMEDHLEERHPNKTRNRTESDRSACEHQNTFNGKFNDDNESVESGTSNKPTIENKRNDKIENNDKNGSNDKVGIKVNDKLGNNEAKPLSVTNKSNGNDLPLTNKDVPRGPNPLTDIIIIHPFDLKMAIPVLSLNVILKRQHFDNYYCGLCDFICEESNILSHISCLPHYQTLQRTPFILPFGNNLIRAIREKFHCAICNIPISVHVIYMHIQEPNHIKLTAIALSVNVGASLIKPSHIPPLHLANNAQIPLAQIPPRPVFNNKNNSNDMINNSSINKNNGNIDVTKTPTRPLVNDKITNNDRSNSKISINDENKSNDKTDLTITNQKVNDVTKNDCDEMELLLNDSTESNDYDMEDYVYVKLKNAYFKIFNTSYNTLVHLGRGNRYCFVCSTRVGVEDLRKHVDSRSHGENLKNAKFVDKFDGTLLRQLFLLYHCSVCNVLVSRRELKNHLTWPTHVEESEASQSASKKTRKNDAKSGKVIHSTVTTKEVIYLNEKESVTEILYKVRVKRTEGPLVKRMKIVIVNNDVLKFAFDNWHGVVECKGGWKCQLCQVEFGGEGLGGHVGGEAHARSLESSANMDSRLLRRINDNTLHCMVCNAEVSDKEHIILEHIGGKRHRNSLDHIRTNSSLTNAYNDCETDVLQL